MKEDNFKKFVISLYEIPWKTELSFALLPLTKHLLNFENLI